MKNRYIILLVAIIITILVIGCSKPEVDEYRIIDPFEDADDGLDGNYSEDEFPENSDMD